MFKKQTTLNKLLIAGGLLSSTLHASVPNAPDNYIGVTAIDESSVRINFLDNANNETGFKIVGQGIDRTLLAHDETKHPYVYVNLTGLVCDQTYTIAVLAYNQEGNSTMTDSRSFNISSTFNMDCNKSSDEEELEKPIDLSVFNVDIAESDEQEGTAYVHITSSLSGDEGDLYDNDRIKELDSGDIGDGYVTLDAGKHLLKICTEESDTQLCSQEQSIMVAKEIEIDRYHAIPIEAVSNGIANDGENIIYGTTEGKLYRLDLESERSTFIYDVNRRVSGLFYVDEENYYYSSALEGGIHRLNIETGEDLTIAGTYFPDGLDVYKEVIYTVTNDRSGILSMWDLDGNFIGSIDTSISDVVGITHTEKYLYVLSEDGEIFQTDPKTGASQKIFNNDGMFSTGNNYMGLEAITIVDKKIYVSYIDDSSIYLIDIDLGEYE